ncbi:CoA-transferase family III [Arthrobacter sp. yr096]|nr:CoA-transferase family III [Arthrobacter sp. yr096]
MNRTDNPLNPLSGHTVIDLSRALAGPHAGMMLADLGARVIKVENPGTGDDTRGWSPPFVGPEDDLQSTYFMSCNRNKESISLDLKSGEGKAVLRGCWNAPTLSSKTSAQVSWAGWGSPRQPCMRLIRAW